MKIDKTKLQRQELGIEKWFHASNFGSKKDRVGGWNWFTGVGKTFASYLLINKLLKNENPLTTVTILCPSDITYKQWTTQKEEFVPKRYHDNISIFIVNTYMERNLHITSDLLIVDEVHEFLTVERFKVFTEEAHTHQWLLTLTSTWEDIHKRHLKLDEICPRIDIIDENEAVEKGFVSKFIEYNIGLDFPIEDKEPYDLVTADIGRGLRKFGKAGLTLAKNCLAGGVNPHDGKVLTNFGWCNMWAAVHGWHRNLNLGIPQEKQINDEWNPNVIMGYARNLMSDIKNRLSIIYNSEAKINLVLEILKKFPDLKTICFSQSTAFADRLTEEINKTFSPAECVVYHSKATDVSLINPLNGKPFYTKDGEIRKFGTASVKKYAIAAIQKGTSRVISTASALDRGFDVKDIRLGIVTSGTQNPTQQKQRKGRVVRLEDIYRKDTTVLIVNLYIKDSRDEESLRKRQRDSKNIVYWIDSVDEISYKPKNSPLNFKEI